MFPIGKWLKDSLKLTIDLLRAQWLPFLVLFAFGCTLNIALEDTMQSMSPTEETQRWVLQLILAIWDLVEGVLLFLILSWGVVKVRLLNPEKLVERPFDSPYLSTLIAEYLRMLAQILMWGLLLLVPGFVRYCQLIFVPFIAVFAKAYRNEDWDALRLSEKLAFKRQRYIVPAILGTMAIQFGLEFVPEVSPELHIIPLRAGFDLLSALISVLSYSLIFLLFDHALKVVSTEE
jgi:hypothetical protein